MLFTFCDSINLPPSHSLPVEKFNLQTNEEQKIDVLKINRSCLIQAPHVNKQQKSVVNCNLFTFMSFCVNCYLRNNADIKWQAMEFLLRTCVEKKKNILIKNWLDFSSVCWWQLGKNPLIIARQITSHWIHSNPLHFMIKWYEIYCLQNPWFEYNKKEKLPK